MKKVAVRNIRLCTKDCLCLYVCPTGAADTEDSIIDTGKCMGCGVCADACLSGAISMMPVELPPQQEKAGDVISALHALADSKARQEKTARQIAGEAGSDGLYRLMMAVARSERLVAEDFLRESGYMLPQSGIAQELLLGLIENPPTPGFPLEAARELLQRIPPNEEKT